MRSSAKIAVVKTLSLAIALACVLVLVVHAAFEHWGRSGHGLVASVALTGLELMLFVELRRQGDDLLDLLRGAQGEEAVGAKLESLRGEGWLVDHNLLKPYGGNIDHIVVGSTGAFAIETKTGRYRSSAGTQAIGSAMALREMTGIGWVTAVVSTPTGDPPICKGNAWVVGHDELIDWLRSARLHRG